MTSPSPLAGEGLGRGEAERQRQKLMRSRAKAMRSAPTEAEHRMWKLLRAKRFGGFKFRRQVPVDHYIVDFLCPGERLIVELDGGQHSACETDGYRDFYLRGQGFRIIRIWNNELFANEEGVAELILSALRQPLSPTPLPRRGEGLTGAPNA